MTLDELDVALEELETRLERLRALYEQYFLGFEKIEPAVARKDVDRRIYVMRREKIRNTGRRFKLQTLIQRYNTYQQYWQRICREIENGTYRRHVLRAERLMSPEQQLTIAARRRFGKKVGDVASSQAAEGGGAQSSKPPPALDDDFDFDAPTLPPPAPAARAAQSSVPPPSRSTPSERARKLESLELDMGFLGDWDPEAPKNQPPPKAAAPPRPAPKPVAAEPLRPAPPPKPAPPVTAAAPPRPAPPPKPGSPLKPGHAAAAPPAKPPRPDAAPPAATRVGGMSEDRVKELHAKLTELKRQNREAGQVSLETLAKTLRETENKLRAEYKNRKIDFEVVLRDGKAIVKPTVR